MFSMKAVILAGGNGTRLHPLTSVTNKHLLPVYDRPVIQYAIDRVVSFGIKEVMIVTSPECVKDFKKYIVNEKRCKISFGIQKRPLGIAHGLHIAKNFVGKNNFLLWLGDGIIEDDLVPHIEDFSSGARIFIKRVNDPERFGVATVDQKRNVLEIIEKPKKPISQYAVTGVYLYDPTVFEKMKDQPMSDRGEYEITYLNNLYIKDNALKAVFLKKKWFDIGTFESLYEATRYMREKARKKLRNCS